MWVKLQLNKTKNKNKNQYNLSKLNKRCCCIFRMFVSNFYPFRSLVMYIASMFSTTFFNFVLKDTEQFLNYSYQKNHAKNRTKTANRQSKTPIYNASSLHIIILWFCCSNYHCIILQSAQVLQDILPPEYDGWWTIGSKFARYQRVSCSSYIVWFEPGGVRKTIVSVGQNPKRPFLQTDSLADT